jgi:hypothetical protein
MYERASSSGELALRWAERDAAYAAQRTPLDPELIEAVRHARMEEAGSLPDVAERGRMWMRATTWMPPVHPDFGGLSDWLE